MSSSSSLTGGKYTRDLKLRVLEHYFRSGGDVFGNKQATAKKFGVDSKTINRFLKIPELVRVARKNAKSSKAARSNDGFKEPPAPGPSGAGRTRPPQRQSVRITLPSQPDESIVCQNADSHSSSIVKLLKIFELGTQEIRDLLAAECDLIYECRACRALFRSVANLLAHKRRYCTRPAVDTRQVFGSGPGQSLAAPSDGVVVLPLPAAIDRLPEVRQAAAAEARAAAAQPVPPVRLEPLPGSAAAVVQTVGEPERSVGERLDEVRRMEAAAQRTVRLGRDGRVVESDGEEEEEAEDTEEAEQAEGEDGRHVCQHCNTTFATRKTLSHHMRSLHASTRIYYPCCLCSAAFINMFSVERHLQKVHKKKQEEVEVLKEGIKQKSFHRNVADAQADGAATSTNMPVKVTSFEWKCRQCSRRYLSLPVGLQHVQSAHPQFSSARAGLVRVCRVIRQSADPAAVSTRSSSGAVTPADRERPAAARDDDRETDGDAAGDGDERMLFNKANLLKRLSGGSERCVLCKKVFTGHLQACGHLRLHDQREIEAYLGQKVRLIRKRRPADEQLEPEEYELEGPAGASPPDGPELESDADAESVTESPADTPTEPPTSVAALHAVDGLVGVPAAIGPRSDGEPEEADAVSGEEAEDTEPAEPAEEEEPEEEPEEEDDNEDEDMDTGADGETASVDTDIESGARLLVSCKLWSPGKRRRAEAAKEEPDEEPEDEEEEEEDENTEQDDAPLKQELDGETVNKWEVIRRKGSRLRCGVCNKTFVRNSYAEIHLRTEHTFEEIREFVKNWPMKGARVPPDTEDLDSDEEEEQSDDEEPDDGPPKLHPEVEPKPNTRQEVEQKGAKRAAESPAAAATAPKAVKREQTVLNVPLIKTSRNLAQGAVGPIGPNTRVLKISRSDLLSKRQDGSRFCLVCNRRFESHPEACEHMRQHSDADIRNFIKTRGREFLPAFERRQRQKERRVSEGAAGTGPAPVTPTSAAGAPVRSLSLGAADKASPPSDAANVTVESSKPAAEATPPAQDAKKSAESVPKPAPKSPAQKSEAPQFHRDEAVTEFELFDKAQLLKRQKDGTKCLLCTRVFAKHSSACGHLSHHGAAEVQAWRTRLRLKASALLQTLSRRPRAYSGSETERGGNSAAGGPESQEAVMETDSPAGDEPADETDAKEETAQPRAKKAKGDSSPTKATKANEVAAVRSTRRKDSAPVKVTRASSNAAEKESSKDEPATAQTVKSRTASLTSGDGESETKAVPVTHGARGTGRYVADSQKGTTKQARRTELASSPVGKGTAEPPAKTASATSQDGKKSSNGPPKSTPNQPATEQPTEKSPAKTPAKSAPPVSAVAIPIKPVVLSSTVAAALAGAASVTVSVASSGAVTVVSAAGLTRPAGGAAPVRAAQLVKLPQAVKLALLQSADGTIQTSGGRTIMRLAPGVKLPITAADLPRVLRPIAPKGTEAGTGAGAVLQPPTPGAVTSPGGPARPRPPPLLRAPLLQAMPRPGGGSVTVHVPSLKTTTSVPAGVVTAVIQAGARPAGAADGGVKPAIKIEGKSGGQENKIDAEAKGVSGEKAKVKAYGKTPIKVTTNTESAAEIKNEQGTVSEGVDLAKRPAETKGSATKTPAAAAHAKTDDKSEQVARGSQRRAAAAEKSSDRPAPTTVTVLPGTKPTVLTKRAFIPETAGKSSTRCSWTPEPGGKASPRAPVAEPAPKSSPVVPPAGEVPQTRARAEAAVAARVRQTRRRSSSASALDRK
ncbi:uncharacterized protein LOC122371708 [Amphibalanus amphitrite]|uniref:uncharacterized protein LOC122371708 n=1 Tax=Amphibalanus amphitrite TaxID=1232801 RepID=UPI001C92750B|nr:uncharacterized protein LOC122371708 [Amphibalanus amphitrite]XP_043204208.1 uncharacterized protein LOC122371708 [Amphibalanus amphitrite]